MTADASSPQPRTYAIAPQGRAEVEIRAASIGDVPWKVSPTNPTGECLKLRLSAGRDRGFLFVDVPRDCKWMVRALGTALGIQPGADGMVTLPDAHELVGRTVAVEIKHFQTISKQISPAPPTFPLTSFAIFPFPHHNNLLKRATFPNIRQRPFHRRSLYFRRTNIR